jgi:hypothetical protein
VPNLLQEASDLFEIVSQVLGLQRVLSRITQESGDRMKSISPEQFVAQKEFASRLALMQIEAGKVGLYATMHKIHEAIKQVGYEIAGTPELYDKVEKIRSKRISKI